MSGSGDVVFRDARAGDVAAIRELLIEDSMDGGPPPSLDVFTESFHQMCAVTNARVIVGERRGQVIACAQVILIHGLSFSAPRHAILEGVRVAADLRGQGLGAQLVDEAERWARSLGATRLQFTSNAVRRDARRFYESLGYVTSHTGFRKALTP
ncbi:GNAT family N-acetyltransferase [Palleronia caenipelagi]|uniref:GNAT family N-acetyltransferase n=1 Tax=Palleronia caenipelagi TaxID=2489174 RepID=A0A547Q582_9RHOB|nr:GNAT family N-acetyltransferase [Palleronia caenipelagi]TRD21528.1 GNAT family N-acetyltransferase [Palleronia caenipelagi]